MTPPPSVQAGPPQVEDEFDAFAAGGGAGGGRRVEQTVIHQGYGQQPAPEVRAGHPELREPGGGWGALAGTGAGPGAGAAYGDWRGAPRPTRNTPGPFPDHYIPDHHTPAFGTPAAGFPQVDLENLEIFENLEAQARPAENAVTSTGSHRRVPVPRTGDDDDDRPAAPAPGRGTKVRTYTGMAAAAVTTVLAVVVAGQVVAEDDAGRTGTRAADDGKDRAAAGQSAASRSDERPTPDASQSSVAAAAPAVPAAPVEKSYEQKMAEQFPIDPKLKGPGTFDAVPGLAKAPGKGKLVRYRVDVEQGLGLDGQLFAEAVQRTLNDDRSWAHNGARTFERVPSGEVDFVITLASPGTTGIWCAKSDLDTTVDNVSCDSASTDRVMINAFRWAQGSQTYGAQAMFAYRQMLINHEVGHRLGNGHVSCRTPGALAPIMQQQTKSLDVDGIHCKPNPWVYPGS
ncbi:DUF3152 domain-containing protein [Streptomyces sp. NPDC002054]|uniref:DUF3152 domain-containing protein n=1 Tax=Streptomyces sp. NPDC002054 TaxID=3154663 RepID=UPI00331F5DB3